MLPRLYSHVVEAIQPCCRGYTVILRMLHSHVAEIYSLVSNVVINSYSLIFTKPVKSSLELLTSWEILPFNLCLLIGWKLSNITGPLGMVLFPTLNG